MKEYAKEEIIINKDKVFCFACNKFHNVNAFCTKCGTCLYKYSYEKFDELEHYIHICKKCKHKNYWENTND